MERGMARHSGNALCLGQWYRAELVPRRDGGYQLPLLAPRPYVSSYLFLLPVYDAPSSAERREREKRREEKRTGEEREETKKGIDREVEEERWFVNIHYVCAEKGETGKKGKSGTRTERRDGGNTRVESARRARHARIYSPTSACKGPAKKKKRGKMCRRTNVAGRLN